LVILTNITFLLHLQHHHYRIDYRNPREHYHRFIVVILLNILLIRIGISIITITITIIIITTIIIIIIANVLVITSAVILDAAQTVAAPSSSRRLSKSL